MEALQRIEQNKLKLAHYTRFDIAKQIIAGRSVWMRNARMMNDIGEVEYGIAAMDRALAEHRDYMTAALGAIDSALPHQLEAAWGHLRSHVVKEVFISCFSEHWPKEDPYGRLSMWRGYGSPDGVALVLNFEAFRLESNALNAYSSPVFYGELHEFSQRFKAVLTNVADNAAALKASMSPQMVLQTLAMALLFGAVCLKHPGFSEEKEWRVIHMPNIQQPTLLKRKSFAGPPVQTVYAIPLEDSPEQGLVGITPDALIHKVIIGPSNRPDEIADELAQMLAAQGVVDPAARIIKSGIPLRV